MKIANYYKSMTDYVYHIFQRYLDETGYRDDDYIVTLTIGHSKNEHVTTGFMFMKKQKKITLPECYCYDIDWDFDEGERYIYNMTITPLHEVREIINNVAFDYPYEQKYIKTYTFEEGKDGQ